MYTDLNDYNLVKLRKDLKDYFIGVMYSLSPVALVDLSRVEKASDEELIQIAIDNKFELDKYKKGRIY